MDFYIRFYYPFFRILFKIASVFIFVIIIILIFLFVSWDKNIFPYNVYAIESESMNPLLKRGDMIIVKNEKEYQINDIITFYVPHRKEYITHRIVRIEKGFYYTKGDANEAADNYKIDSGDISGKYVYKVNKLGFGVIFLKTITGVITCIVIPSSLLLGMIISDFGRKVKKYGQSVIAKD